MIGIVDKFVVLCVSCHVMSRWYKVVWMSTCCVELCSRDSVVWGRGGGREGVKVPVHVFHVNKKGGEGREVSDIDIMRAISALFSLFVCVADVGCVTCQMWCL